MKVVLDTCVWGGAQAALIERGHDVVWVGSWDRDPGDEEILQWAMEQGRVLVTLDKDFGELAIVRGLAHAGIVRLVGVGATEQGPVTLRVLDLYGVALAKGAIVTVEPGRVRLRDPEEGRA